MKKIIAIISVLIMLSSCTDTIADFSYGDVVVQGIRKVDDVYYVELIGPLEKGARSVNYYFHVRYPHDPGFKIGDELIFVKKGEDGE